MKSASVTVITCIRMSVSKCGNAKKSTGAYVVVEIVLEGFHLQ